MPYPTPAAEPATAAAATWRSRISAAAFGLALLMLAGTYLLMSPAAGATYPGAIAWKPGSLLKIVTDLMSLGGGVHSPRGVEIKDLVFQLAVAGGLLLLAARSVVALLGRDERPIGRGPWLAAQVFLACWVALSTVSALWSREPSFALGQAALYGFGLAWAISLAWTLENRDVPRLLWAYVAIAAIGALLCIAYYHIRNPYHRPGFPIGNPSTLAACTLPALIIATTSLLGAVVQARREGSRLPLGRLVALCACLLPLVGCFLLTNSRGALFGLVVGVVGALFMLVPRRVRWWAAGLAPLLLVAGWWVLASNQDLAMGRGATIRFRVYAWQYAALLWWHRPISGHGAGAYCQLAGTLATRDRALDPAAFTADGVEHAHNELFEVLCEIGLLGGVTFVGGYVAVLLAAAALLRSNLSSERRFLVLGLVAGLLGLMGDAMFGVGLRLEGVPAVFYSLLGALLALARSTSRDRSQDAASAPWTRAARIAVGVGAVLSAGTLGRLALQNWSGARAEHEAMLLDARGEHDASIAQIAVARERLLDPVRKLVAADRGIRTEASHARIALEAAKRRGVLGDAAEVQRISQLAEAGFNAAIGQSVRASGFGRAPMYAALCAEVLAEALAATDAAKSSEWWMTAARAWRAQQQQRPYDPTTLMALTRYTNSTPELLALLRDALRSGFPPPEWAEALPRVLARPDCPAALDTLMQSIGPLNPETDADLLAAASAPEMHRLAALALALRGEPAQAEAAAARAAAMYKPMKLRFPELYSVALAEQSDYCLRSDPGEPRRTIALLSTAIDALPRIQEQKFEALLQPFRLRLAVAKLAAGDTASAAEIIASELGESGVADAVANTYSSLIDMAIRAGTAPEKVDRWIAAALEASPAHPRVWLARVWRAAAGGAAPEDVAVLVQSAVNAGVANDGIEQIRRIVCADHPRYCDALGVTPTRRP